MHVLKSLLAQSVLLFYFIFIFIFVFLKRNCSFWYRFNYVAPAWWVLINSHYFPLAYKVFGSQRESSSSQNFQLLVFFFTTIPFHHNLTKKSFSYDNLDFSHYLAHSHYHLCIIYFFRHTTYTHEIIMQTCGYEK